MAAFMWKEQSWVVTTEIAWPAKNLNYFLSLQNNFADPWSIAIGQDKLYWQGNTCTWDISYAVLPIYYLSSAPTCLMHCMWWEKITNAVILSLMYSTVFIELCSRRGADYWGSSNKAVISHTTRRSQSGTSDSRIPMCIHQYHSASSFPLRIQSPVIWLLSFAVFKQQDGEKDPALQTLTQGCRACLVP